MFMQSNYVRVLSGCGYGGGVVGLSVASALVAVGGFAPCEAHWRRVVGVSPPCVAQFPHRGSPPAISHAIPSKNHISLFQFAFVCHLCFGIACDFG